jgi:hypothetical protein
MPGQPPMPGSNMPAGAPGPPGPGGFGPVGPGPGPGRAVQVDPIKPTLKAPGTDLLKSN